MKRILFVLLVAGMVISAGCSSTADSIDSGLQEAMQAAQTQEIAQEATPTPAPTPEPTPELVAASEVTYVSAFPWTTSLGSTFVQTIVEVTNTGDIPLYFGQSNYDLEDSTGALIAAQKNVSVFPNVIHPGEKGYMYESTKVDITPAEGEITVYYNLNLSPTASSLVDLPISDVSMSASDFYLFTILGRVENNTEEAHNWIRVWVALYDADGTILGIEQTVLIDELAPGAKSSFEITSVMLPDSIEYEDIASYKVYAYPALSTLE